MILTIIEIVGSKKSQFSFPISEISYIQHMTHDDYYECDNYYIHLKSGKCFLVGTDIIETVENYWKEK